MTFGGFGTAAGFMCAGTAISFSTPMFCVFFGFGCGCMLMSMEAYRQLSRLDQEEAPDKQS